MRAFSPASFLRLLAAVALTAYLLWLSDPTEIARHLVRADARWIVLALVLVAVDRALMAYRWVALLRPLESGRPAIAALMRIFFVSTFAGTFLPGSIGGDAVRAYSLSRLQVNAGAAVASVVMDRVLGVLAILIMCAVALVAVREMARSPAILAALAVTAAGCGVAAAVVFSSRVAAAAGAWSQWLPGRRVRTLATDLLSATRRYADHHRTLAAVLVYSVAVQVLRIVQAYCLGLALGIPLGAGPYFAFIPLILLVMLLPITINGLGTSQAGFIWFFGRAGVQPPEAFALSVLFLALGVAGNLPGAFLYASSPALPASQPRR